MKTHLLQLLCVASLVASPAWAVNKCTGADGRVSFQDAPCSGKGESLNVRPANGDASPVDANATANSWRLKAAQVDARLAIQAAIERREPMIGMTPAQLEMAMGLPNRINTGEYQSSSTQQRIYERGQITWYVYTDGALVTAVQTSISPSVNRRGSAPCPSSAEIRSAETSASSITLSDAERVERQKQIRDMRNCGR